MSPNIFFRMVRVALTPRNMVLTTRLANGAIISGKNRSGYGGRGIYIYRDAVEPEYEHFLKFLSAGDVVIDVGANTGIYTIKGAKYLSENGGQVVALEPIPEILATLHHNIRANQFNNVRLRNVCAGDHTHTAAFWQNFDTPNTFSLEKRDETASSFSVMVVALDDLFVWEGLKRLNYLKIDAEGAEAQIFLGAKKTIEKYRPIIQVEINVADPHLTVPDYTAFQATSGSPNRLLIPNENPKINIPLELGWLKV